MTPKEKAEELVEAFMSTKQTKLSDYSRIYQPTAKQCALIAVDEIIKLCWNGNKIANDYWQEVKKEIEKI